MKPVVLIGYSGHAYVACEIFHSMNREVKAYADSGQKNKNPYNLTWLGDETDESVLEKIRSYDYFVSVGNNAIRQRITQNLIQHIGFPENAIDSSATLSKTVEYGYGNMFAPGVKINALAKIGNGVICNTGAIIEHECVLNHYVHIAPGAVLCGNVSVGEGSFIGANAVLRQGITIGKNVTVGAGTVVVKNIEDNLIVIGNPQRFK